MVSLADTQIIEIKYKTSSPEEAVKLVSAIKDEFVKLSTELVPNGNVQVLEEPRFPLRAVSPNKSMGLIIAIVLGVFIGIGVIFLIEFMDNTYKNKDRLEEELNIPVLGIIPKIDL